MNFNTGQKVLCVYDHFGSYCAYPIKKELIYTIHGFYKCDCGSDQVTLKEIPEELDVRIPEPQKETSEERLKTINRKIYLILIMSK